MASQPLPDFPRPPRFVLFDCYGTLIRWNEGLEETFAALLRDKGAAVVPTQFRDTFKTHSYALIQQTYRPYQEILRESLRLALGRHGLRYHDADGRRLVEAIQRFPAHPEVHDVLLRIRTAASLAVISNSDEDLLPHSLRNIGVPFDVVVTAERARAYKPAEAIFRFAMEQMGCRPGDFVHVAAGWWTDIEPATRLGLHKVWINRRNEPGDEKCQPYGELPTLAGLPELLGIAGPPRTEG
jgi:2-haloalkanoic acid dehalogenase type II